jgi:hypothetical protein
MVEVIRVKLRGAMDDDESELLRRKQILRDGVKIATYYLRREVARKENGQPRMLGASDEIKVIR